MGKVKILYVPGRPNQGDEPGPTSRRIEYLVKQVLHRPDLRRRCELSCFRYAYDITQGGRGFRFGYRKLAEKVAGADLMVGFSFGAYLLFRSCEHIRRAGHNASWGRHLLLNAYLGTTRSNNGLHGVRDAGADAVHSLLGLRFDDPCRALFMDDRLTFVHARNDPTTHIGQIALLGGAGARVVIVEGGHELEGADEVIAQELLRMINKIIEEGRGF